VIETRRVFLAGLAVSQTDHGRFGRDGGAAPRSLTTAKRQKILAAMLAVVGEDGYERASVQAVLERAGLGRLLDLLDEDPLLGRALLVEVHPAGGRALTARRRRSPRR
jgi:hypothetical protein